MSDEEATKQLLAIAREGAANGTSDLVALPEAAFPPINDETRAELARAPIGPFLEATYQQLRDLAATHQTTLIVGANSVLDCTRIERSLGIRLPYWQESLEAGLDRLADEPAEIVA